MEDNTGKTEITIDLSFEERRELWCIIHKKSIHWGRNITEEQLNEWGCPTERVEYI